MIAAIPPSSGNITEGQFGKKAEWERIVGASVKLT
jgi:hypothetical protein